jgi:subtilisin family serine protease
VSLKKAVLSGAFLAALAVGANADAAFAKEYIIKFKDDLSITRGSGHRAVVSHLQSQLEKNLKQVRRSVNLSQAKKLWIVNSIATSLNKDELNLVKSLPNVEEVRPVTYKKWISPDIEKKIVRTQPTSPQWSVQKVRAPEVWAEFKMDGTGIVVGHLDTGIDAEHPILKDRTIAFKDYTPLAKEKAYDDQGHGTHTAGSIAGDKGVGVAPGAKLIVAKVFDSKGGAEDTWLLGAMQWMLDPDGNPETNDAPHLVSNSWGSNDTTDKVFWGAVQAWVDAGIVPVFAAGNNGPSGKCGTPANFPHSWAVAATTKTDGIAYFSSVGPIVWDGVTLTKPDIAAPGHGVISCAVGGGLVSNSGTSMACPHVAGLVALMLQANPALTIDQVRKIAEDTAVDLGTPGKDNKFGSGRFDAMACMKKVMEGANLAHSFKAYESALTAETSLVGVQANSPLAAPLADSIIDRCRTLDEGEFNTLQKDVQAGCGEAAQLLLKKSIQVRTGEKLNN